MSLKTGWLRITDTTVIRVLTLVLSATIISFLVFTWNGYFESSREPPARIAAESAPHDLVIREGLNVFDNGDTIIYKGVQIFKPRPGMGGVMAVIPFVCSPGWRPNVISGGDKTYAFCAKGRE